MPEDNAAMRIDELEVDNRRLRRLLDQRDAPGELRHRLRNTVAMLRTIIRKSARTERDFDTYVGHLEDRLDALTRAHAAADERGWVELHDLLADELLYYGASDGERAILSGPAIDLQPRAGQVLGLAIHELAVNAVEHGALGTSVGRVEVKWELSGVQQEPWLTLDWREISSATPPGPSREGFGTEVLTRTLAYELKAETNVTYDPEGLRCTIRFPFPERIGRVGGDRTIAA